MGIKKYFASKDNTITNAFKENLFTRGTGSNMGAADILETFIIHGQATASLTAAPSLANATGAEQSRILLQFPIDKITSDVAAGVLPLDTSSIAFTLNLYNAPQGGTTPLSYSLDVNMVSPTWNEGRGLDMDNYTDLGASNWIQSDTGTSWTWPGGDYIVGPDASSSYFFSTGLENLKLDVSSMVYRWLNGTNTNQGFLCKFPDTDVSGSDTFFTKMFFARTSEFFHYRPTLEAKWNSSREDNRGSFFMSSSAASSANNLNTIYMYNNVRGQLQNLPGLQNNTLSVELYQQGTTTTTTGGPLRVVNEAAATVTSVVGGLLRENGVTVTGVYTASFASTSSFVTMRDVWSTGSGPSRQEYYTGSIKPQSFPTTALIRDEDYITTITNLQDSYLKGETPRLRIFPRRKDWSPTIFTIATKTIIPNIIEDSYYKLSRVVDNMVIVPYGTGSSDNYFTKMSYDVSGNYFDLDTNCLEPGYSYSLKFAYYLGGKYLEQPETFKFKVEEKLQ
mgnify:CR=1 FL=1